MGNTKASGNLPDTLTPLSYPQHEQKITQIKLPWGRLYSCVEKFKSVDLIDNTITLGRSENSTLLVSEKNFPENIVLIISKRHFLINRDEYTDLIYLKDESKNGTFINGVRVGKGKRHILQNDDEISVGLNGLQTLFIFKLLQNCESTEYLPLELRKKYKLSRYLGKGAAGEVHLLFEKSTTKAYAVKKIKKGIYSTESQHHLDHPVKIMNEVAILRSLAHPCIIFMKEIIETETDVFLILEYMGGGVLTKRITSAVPMTEQNIKFLFYQIVLAVQYLHDQGITHRDLKPDNVLLATDAIETLVKITDFGLSKFLNEFTLMETICGTPTYVAPEIINSSFSEYSNKVDVWSLGVILFYMFAKELPFRSSDRATLNRLIMAGRFNFTSEKWLGVSNFAKDLIRKLLNVEPLRRLDINQVLQHPWLSRDMEVQYKVNKTISSKDLQNSDYFIDDTESDQAKNEGPPFKRLKLLETTV